MAAKAEAKQPGQQSHTTKLINLALTLAEGELFRNPEGEHYITVPIGKFKETLVLTDKPFREWLARAYFTATKAGVHGGALADAVTALSGGARASGRIHPIYTRVAATEAGVYLDLGRDDRLVLAIAPNGWSVTCPPNEVRFVRRKGALPLPDPKKGRSLAELLPKVVNVKEGSPDLKLLVGWLIGALRGLKPFPILVIVGEQGTAKSYACRFARQCIDPSQADLSLTPKDPRDLLITTLNSHVIGFDNLSFMPDWLSDVLCSIATGAGFRTRQLTTDSTETIFAAARPVVMNSIVDIVRRGDLMDRALTVGLEPIAEKERRTEADIDARFREAQPEILGALADAVAQALREPVKLSRLPRMADFAITVESAAPALGWEPGEFLRVYNASRAGAAEGLMDGDAVVTALKLIHEADQARPWVGSSDGLFDRIKGVTSQARQESKHFPSSPQALVGQLRRLAPMLRTIGIDVELPTLKWVDDPNGGPRKVQRRLMSLRYPNAQSDIRFEESE